MSGYVSGDRYDSDDLLVPVKRSTAYFTESSCASAAQEFINGSRYLFAVLDLLEITGKCFEMFWCNYVQLRYLLADKVFGFVTKHFLYRW